VKPFDQIASLEEASALDGAAKVLVAMSAAVRSQPQLAATLAGEPFGHSAHPMLVQIPIGAWVSAGWLDCLPRTERSAAVLTGIGVAAALPAAAAGIVDYGALDSRRRRIAALHAAANTISLACQVASLRDRLNGKLRRGQWVGLAGTLTLSFGGVLGGHLAHRLPDQPAA
jgi:uncharacterized membrane protein